MAEPKTFSHPRDPLHGITLEKILNQLVQKHGWREMGRQIPIRCFQFNPTVKSSLTFLRKTPWAREKVEDWFIEDSNKVENRQNLIQQLNPKKQRGSKPRCHLLTHGIRDLVASRLTMLIAPWGQVRSSDLWTPDGFGKPAEAQWQGAPWLLDKELSNGLLKWWLPGATELKTPNWDVASTCLIDGVKGLLLIEAKAHDKGLTKEEKGRRLEVNPSKDSLKNHEHIGQTIIEANSELNAICPGWNLSRDSHYQMVNRFVWAWKLASLGIPVVLVYLGFLKAVEMQDRGKVFENHSDWQQLVLSHSKTIVPENVWETKLNCQGSALIPLIRTIECPLE